MTDYLASSKFMVKQRILQVHFGVKKYKCERLRVKPVSAGIFGHLPPHLQYSRKNVKVENFKLGNMIGEWI